MKFVLLYNYCSCTVSNCNQENGFWCPNGWWEILSDFTLNDGYFLEWQFLPTDNKLSPQYYGLTSQHSDDWQSYYEGQCIDINDILTLNGITSCDDYLGCRNLDILVNDLNVTQIQTIINQTGQDTFCIRGMRFDPSSYFSY